MRIQSRYSIASGELFINIICIAMACSEKSTFEACSKKYTNDVRRNLPTFEHVVSEESQGVLWTRYSFLLKFKQNSHGFRGNLLSFT